VRVGRIQKNPERFAFLYDLSFVSNRHGEAASTSGNHKFFWVQKGDLPNRGNIDLCANGGGRSEERKRVGIASGACGGLRANLRTATVCRIDLSNRSALQQKTRGTGPELNAAGIIGAEFIAGVDGGADISNSGADVAAIGSNDGSERCNVGSRGSQ
jgi:hypothetical protein